MNQTTRGAVAGLALLIALAAWVAGQSDEAAVRGRLAAVSDELRMALTLATIAAHSPTIGDLRLHAQQLVNLLEGSEGKHFARPVGPAGELAGLLVEADALRLRFEALPIEPRIRASTLDASRNLRSFLSFALDATLSALGERRIEQASASMLRAYAFLLAAYERPCEIAYVPALWTILRTFGPTEAAAGEPD